MPAPARGTQACAAGTLTARAATTGITSACAAEDTACRRDLVVSRGKAGLQAIAVAVSHHLQTDHP